MKKSIRILGTICASAIALSMCSLVPASAESGASLRIMGDMNNDLKVDAADAQETLSVYVSTVAGNADDAVTEKTENADINMDGKIDIEDASGILSYYCQTLAGGQPLWAEFRKVSYQDGNGFAPMYLHDPETGEKLLDDSGNPIQVERAFALRGMYLEIGCASGKPGETVTVPVYVAGVPALAGFQLSVFHEQPLKLLDIESKINQQEGWNPDDEPICNPAADTNQGIVVAAQAWNVSLADGFVLAEFSYQIPENAKSGDRYAITVDQSWTKFVSNDCTFVKVSDTKMIDSGSYQYTSLDGIVTVK